jgi:hypothetical protein
MNLINSTEIIYDEHWLGNICFCYTVKPGANITRIYQIIIYTLRQQLRATSKKKFYFLRMKEVEATCFFHNISLWIRSRVTIWVILEAD